MTVWRCMCWASECVGMWRWVYFGCVRCHLRWFFEHWTRSGSKCSNQCNDGVFGRNIFFLAPFRPFLGFSNFHFRFSFSIFNDFLRFSWVSYQLHRFRRCLMFISINFLCVHWIWYDFCLFFPFGTISAKKYFMIFSTPTRNIKISVNFMHLYWLVQPFRNFRGIATIPSWLQMAKTPIRTIPIPKKRYSQFNETPKTTIPIV